MKHPWLIYSLAALVLTISSCKTVPLTGRKQLNMVPNSIGSTLALSLPNSRMQESEADKLGLIFMSMAGYNPEEAVPFWQRMASKNNGAKLPQFLSTHPSDETRVKKLTTMIPEIKEKYYKPN